MTEALLVGKLMIMPVRIDAQEVMSADIDFRIIARLLDFYRIKLGLSKGFFPGLPQNYQKKYFRN